MASTRTLNRLGEIAGEQWGLITRKQAQQAGVPLKTLDRLTAEGSVLERVAHGVYRLTTAPIPDHIDLRAAWLQLAPSIPAWERTTDDGVVSRRSAAALYKVGHLPADQHEFIVQKRKQSRRPDVRLHMGKLRDNEWIEVKGLPVTIPSRTAADLLDEDEDPAAVAQVVADAIRHVYDYPGAFVEALRPHALRFGFRRGDGMGLLGWLFDLVDDPEIPTWMREAREDIQRRGEVMGSARDRTAHPG